MRVFVTTEHGSPLDRESQGPPLPLTRELTVAVFARLQGRFAHLGRHSAERGPALK